MKESISIVSFINYDKSKLEIDMWYGDTVKDCDEFSWGFYDGSCEYRGNLYKQDKIVGDFHSPTLQNFVDVWNKAHPENTYNY